VFEHTWKNDPKRLAEWTQFKTKLDAAAENRNKVVHAAWEVEGGQLLRITKKKGKDSREPFSEQQLRKIADEVRDVCAELGRILYFG